MRKDEIINRNISLTFDFLRYITEHPDVVERIPDGSELEFIDKGFPLPREDKSRESEKKVVLKVGYVFDISS